MHGLGSDARWFPMIDPNKLTIAEPTEVRTMTILHAMTDRARAPLLQRGHI